MTAVRTIVWQAIPWTGLDYFTLTPVENEFLAEGRLVGVDEGVPYTYHYQIRTDNQWRVRELIIYTGVNDQILFHLIADGQGHWYEQNGVMVPELAGCLDVDLTLTPFTNTLPIRRLAFLPDQPHHISVVYIELPTGKISRAEQFYTQLSPLLYRFQQPAIDFSADLTIDTDGLVIDYPDLFRRVY